MTTRRKIVFALLTVFLFVGIVEGVAQLYWWQLQRKVLRNSEALLRNDAINFMKAVDPVYGYVLKPGEYSQSLYVNAKGFMQRDIVPLARKADHLRLIAMGESTTMGHDVDAGNYPVHLRRIFQQHSKNSTGVEVINAGVAGWTSDQLMLLAEREMAAYRPDIVILYVGWNDFQNYDPYGPPPKKSYFAAAYGGTRSVIDASGLKSLVLFSAMYSALAEKIRVPSKSGQVTPKETYRYFMENIDRIVQTYRQANPSVVIALCTLASRWPQGTRQQFDEGSGHVWWMEGRKLGPKDAESSLATFNGLIRELAQSRRLLLVDIAHLFENLDRGALFWDFAHLHPEGYELVAELMYETLRRAEVINGDLSSRREELLRKYEHRTVTLK